MWLQTEADNSVSDSNPHIINIGKMIEVWIASVLFYDLIFFGKYMLFLIIKKNISTKRKAIIFSFSQLHKLKIKCTFFLLLFLLLLLFWCWYSFKNMKKNKNVSLWFCQNCYSQKVEYHFIWTQLAGLWMVWVAFSTIIYVYSLSKEK